MGADGDGARDKGERGSREAKACGAKQQTSQAEVGERRIRRGRKKDETNNCIVMMPERRSAPGKSVSCCGPDREPHESQRRNRDALEIPRAREQRQVLGWRRRIGVGEFASWTRPHHFVARLASRVASVPATWGQSSDPQRRSSARKPARAGGDHVRIAASLARSDNLCTRVMQRKTEANCTTLQQPNEQWTCKTQETKRVYSPTCQDIHRDHFFGYQIRCS